MSNIRKKSCDCKILFNFTTNRHRYDKNIRIGLGNRLDRMGSRRAERHGICLARPRCRHLSGRRGTRKEQREARRARPNRSPRPAPSLCPATIAQDRFAPCARSPRPLSCSDRRTTERLETEENLSADGRIHPLATNGRPHGQESLPRPLQGADRNARPRHAKGPLHARPGLISSGAAARIPEQSQGCRRRKRER